MLTHTIHCVHSITGLPQGTVYLVPWKPTTVVNKLGIAIQGRTRSPAKSEGVYWSTNVRPTSDQQALRSPRTQDNPNIVMPVN